MAARSSRAARSVSATSSSKCRSCTAASTCVLSVRCLPRALTRPRALKRSSMVSSSRSSAPPATRRARNSASTLKWKPGGGQLEPERGLPVDAGAHGVGGLPVAEVLEELEDRDQRQPPRREAGLAANGVELAEIPVLVEGAELVAQPRDHVALGEGGAGDARGLDGDRTDRFRTQAHGSPPCSTAARIRRQYLSYLPTGEGWLYLAAIEDLATREIVGWSMADHLRADLCVDALVMALQRRRPGPGLVHHSDRGVQPGLNRSSQHQPDRIAARRREPRQAFANRASCAVCC